MSALVIFSVILDLNCAAITSVSADVIGSVMVWPNAEFWVLESCTESIGSERVSKAAKY